MKVGSSIASVFMALWLSPAGHAATGPPSLATGLDPDKAEITILYDAFGKPSDMQKDWGFAALIEYGGKRILFDTGNNPDIFAHNVKFRDVDLTRLDFAIISHRHGDHIGGLNHLLRVNPGVKIFVPKENFGVFGAALPNSFYRRDESLPEEMRYFDGIPPDTLRFGSAWPEARFSRIAQTTEVAPGFHLILLRGSWGVDLDVMELSLAIDTPEGIVLVVGCSHPTIERIVEAAKAEIDEPLHLLVGGTHLLPSSDEEIRRTATALHDTWKLEWIAPGHCTGEPAFAILQKTFGVRYVYAGLGSILGLGSTVTSVAQATSPQAQIMGEDDRRAYATGPAVPHGAVFARP